MKIRNRLNLNTVISIGAVALIILSLVWSYFEDLKVNKNVDLVGELQTVAFERIVLRDDYLLHAEERARIQWLSKSENMRRLLDTADQQITGSGDRGLLREARRDFDATFTSFSGFMENHKIKESDGTKWANLTETESMLISQTFLKAYSLTHDINRLSISVNQKATRVRNRSLVVVGFFLLIGIVGIVANSTVLNRLLTKRITDLGKGVEILGEGNLEYRIDARGDDELSALARHTNEMADKLRMSDTSQEILKREIAERKRAEEKLRESEDRYRDLVEHSQELICTHDLEGRILSVNPWAATVLGYSQEELLRMNFHDVLVPEMHQGFETYLNEIRTHGAAQGRMLVRTRKGERLLWEYKNTLRTEGVEKPIVRGMAQDITERKRAEVEIRSLAKFPSENPDPIMRIATDGTLLYINKSGSRKLSEWNLQAGKIVPPMIRDAASRALNHGSRQIIDLEHNERVYSFTVAPISDADYANLYGRDITEHKRAEQTQMLLVAMLDATPGFVGFADAKDTHILYINSTGREMVGVQAQEDVTRLKIADVHPEWTNKLFRDEIIPSALRDGMWTGECAFLNRDGREIPVMMVLLAHKSPSGEVERFSTISIDITDRKLAEGEKEKLQTQLLQAQKMEAVGRLAGGVAHDFNNLLTVIMGYSELLLGKIGKESPMHGEVEEIRRAGERAASLTQQLLAFSRKQVIEPKVLVLNLLMDNLGKMLVRLIGENIHLKMVPGKDLGLVKVDPGQFDQVLINLAVNARDAMPGGGTLLIETANVELDEEYCAHRPYEIHPGRYVRVAVSDTGHGMAEETRQQIFEPFFTTKEKGKGTGLGLSMVYGAVKQAGGSIEAYSEVGIGTTFKIYLPRVEGDAMKPGEDERSAVLPEGTETVLVVEDDDIVRNLGVRILERLGYRVMQARNGDEAISLAAGYGERIDLLLTDVVMPRMNGSELATQLVLHHPEMEVLFTSGYTDDTITRHGVLDEGVSFVGKPYTTSALARKVREVLDKA